MASPDHKLIAIAGPKGGCGKTTLAVGLAQTLASLDKTVCIVDLDPYGQNAAFALNLQPDIKSFEDTPAVANSAQLGTFACAYSGVPPICMRKTTTKNVWCAVISPDEPLFFERLKTCNCQYIILDMPAGYRNASIFDAADIPILVATPEPASIYEATQWLRYLAETRLQDDPLSVFMSPKGAWLFDDVFRALPDEFHQRFKQILANHRAFFVLNCRREGSEITQSDALCHAWWRLLGTDIRPLGTLRYEERRWFFTRRFSSDNPLEQDDSMQPDLDQIAGKIIADQWPERPCGAIISPVIDPKQFLTVDNDEEPRHAYRRLYEGYRRENALVTWAVPAERISTLMTQLEAAWQHLHNEAVTPSPAAPQTISMSAKVNEILESASTNNSSLPSVTRRLSGAFAAVAAYDPQDCEANAGDWLRACRERAGITLPFLAMKTRISPKTLDNLEKTEIASYSPSHLQAYLFEIAKVLDLPLDELRRKFGFKA